MLTDEELAGMRVTLDLSLPDLAEVTRATSTSDGRGGRTMVWVTVASVPCRVAPDTTRAEGTVADVVTNVQRWMLTMPSGTNVLPDDRISVGTRTFEVVAIRSARSFEVSCRVIGVEVL